MFLNKVDIFRTKITYSSVKQYFPDYEGKTVADSMPENIVETNIVTRCASHPLGDDTDFNGARTYFKQRFCRLNRSTTKEIYPSFTNATDTSLLKIVMASVTDIILTNNLRDSAYILLLSSTHPPVDVAWCPCPSRPIFFRPVLISPPSYASPFSNSTSCASTCSELTTAVVL